VRVSPRILTVLWCGIGIVVWSAVFDWWMHGATREYLRQAAVYEAGRGPEPALAPLMAEARASGVRRATTWAVLITGAGLVTIQLLRTRK
jgi:hypothetical protein